MRNSGYRVSNLPQIQKPQFPGVSLDFNSQQSGPLSLRVKFNPVLSGTFSPHCLEILANVLNIFMCS